MQQQKALFLFIWLNGEGIPYEVDDGTGQMVPVKLVDGTGNPKHMKMSIEYDTTTGNAVEGFHFRDHADNGSGTPIFSADLENMPRGEMQALIEAFGYKDYGWEH